MNNAAQTILAFNPGARPSRSPSAPDRFRRLEKDGFDVIVIGAGTGD
jgi:hypothetical protein